MNHIEARLTSSTEQQPPSNSLTEQLFTLLGDCFEESGKIKAGYRILIHCQNQALIPGQRNFSSIVSKQKIIFLVENYQKMLRKMCLVSVFPEVIKKDNTFWLVPDEPKKNHASLYLSLTVTQLDQPPSVQSVMSEVPEPDGEQEAVSIIEVHQERPVDKKPPSRERKAKPKKYTTSIPVELILEYLRLKGVDAVLMNGTHLPKKKLRVEVVCSTSPSLQKVLKIHTSPPVMYDFESQAFLNGNEDVSDSDLNARLFGETLLAFFNQLEGSMEGLDSLQELIKKEVECLSIQEMKRWKKYPQESSFVQIDRLVLTDHSSVQNKKVKRKTTDSPQKRHAGAAYIQIVDPNTQGEKKPLLVDTNLLGESLDQIVQDCFWGKVSGANNQDLRICSPSASELEYQVQLFEQPESLLKESSSRTPFWKISRQRSNQTPKLVDLEPKPIPDSVQVNVRFLNVEEYALIVEEWKKKLTMEPQNAALQVMNQLLEDRLAKQSTSLERVGSQEYLRVISLLKEEFAQFCTFGKIKNGRIFLDKFLAIPFANRQKPSVYRNFLSVFETHLESFLEEKLQEILKREKKEREERILFQEFTDQEKRVIAGNIKSALSEVIGLSGITADLVDRLCDTVIKTIKHSLSSATQMTLFAGGIEELLPESSDSLVVQKVQGLFAEFVNNQTHQNEAQRLLLETLESVIESSESSLTSRQVISALNPNNQTIEIVQTWKRLTLQAQQEVAVSRQEDFRLHIQSEIESKIITLLSPDSPIQSGQLKLNSLIVFFVQKYQERLESAR